MDPMNEEQLDYGEEEYESSHKSLHRGNGGVIPALVEEQFMGDDDDFGDLYDDVNISAGFMQPLQHTHGSSVPAKSDGMPSGNEDRGKVVTIPGTSPNLSIPGVKTEENNPRSNTIYLKAEQINSVMVEGNGQHHNNPSLKTNASLNSASHSTLENSSFHFGSSQLSSITPQNGVNPIFPSGSSMMPPDPGNVSIGIRPPLPSNQTGIVGSYPVMNGASRPAVGAVNSNGSTSLFVGDLHWWTTDADVENAASQFGRVKEIKFFDERVSGKSKGYCQVDFYDPAAAATCMQGMNGYMFNGRACAVAFASAQTLKQMGANYVKRNQSQVQSQSQGRGNMNDGIGRNGAMNYQGGDGGRNYGRGGWGRGTMNRGQGSGGLIRGRGSNGARDMVGSGGSGPGLMGGPYGQGHGGHGFGGAAGAMMHPQNMMGVGFDPSYMGRGGGAYVGFSAPAFPGMMPQFQAVTPMGLAGVAPHVNPAFFARGMMPNGMGMMGTGAMNGNSAGTWMDAGLAWTGEEQGKTKESSYGGDDGASEYGNGEATNEKEGRSNASWEDKGSRRDEREPDFERSNRDRYREESDGNRDQRQRDREHYDDDDRDRGQTSSRPRSRSRMTNEENHRYHSRDREYGKRRRE